MKSPVPISLWRNQRGTASLLLLFAFSLVFGSMALALDLSRYFAAQSRIQEMTESALMFGAGYRDLIDEGELEPLVRDFVRQGIEETPFLSISDDALALSRFSLSHETGMETVSASLTVTVPTTLMAGFGTMEPVAVSFSGTAKANVRNQEIVILVDRTAEAGDTGKLTYMKKSVRDFLDQLSTLADADQSLYVGMIPFGNEVVHVGSRRDWTVETDWPDNEIPPVVAGYRDWMGTLEEQRWCLGIRSGSSGEDDAPPTENPFPVILTVDHETDPDGQERFFINTPTSCTSMPIHPLGNRIHDLKASSDNWTAHGENAGGRAMLWAERMLAPEWKAAWGGIGSAPSPFDGIVQKAIILLTGSAHSATSGENRIFSETCARLKGKGVSFYMIDYEAPEGMTALMKDCVGDSGSYFRVTGPDILKRSFSEIAHSLMTVRLTSLQ